MCCTFAGTFVGWPPVSKCRRIGLSLGGFSRALPESIASGMLCSLGAVARYSACASNGYCTVFTRAPVAVATNSHNLTAIHASGSTTTSAQDGFRKKVQAPMAAGGQAGLSAEGPTGAGHREPAARVCERQRVGVRDGAARARRLRHPTRRPAGAPSRYTRIVAHIVTCAACALCRPLCCVGAHSILPARSLVD